MRQGKGVRGGVVWRPGRGRAGRGGAGLGQGRAWGARAVVGGQGRAEGGRAWRVLLLKGWEWRQVKGG